MIPKNKKYVNKKTVIFLRTIKNYVQNQHAIGVNFVQIFKGISVDFGKKNGIICIVNDANGIRLEPGGVIRLLSKRPIEK